MSMTQIIESFTTLGSLIYLLPILGLGLRYKVYLILKSKPKSNGFPPITPLHNFTWETEEPIQFRPFKPKYHLTMGLSTLDPSHLLPIDKTYKDRLALRANLLAQHPDTVIGLTDDPRVHGAVEELYSFVLGVYLPSRYPGMFRVEKGVLVNLVNGGKYTLKELSSRKMLENLSQVVDEDFLILLPSPPNPSPSKLPPSPENDPKYHLSAYTTFFPSGFNPSQKLSQFLSSIHAPVPGYSEKLEKSMDRFFEKLEVGKFVSRVNWTVTVREGLFAAFGGTHARAGEGMVEEIEPGMLDVEETNLRCERQTLHRLPTSKALIFAIHTYTYPLQKIKDEGLGEDLAQAIDGLKSGNVPGMHYYKRGAVWGEAVKAFLRE